ncbi:hypothetical protein [Shewanella sp. SR44-3]|uniref:hypothetical protein n=1 Tax=Shewanella sp. SR44-3 TaxID=2760936 RepID=UPI0015FE5FCD|nr:hypothetical protein [Shewanella sp. SR44-3]MBB1269390.1 hypothetical protein [Shewanella sp. SR44-3]
MSNQINILAKISNKSSHAAGFAIIKPMLALAALSLTLVVTHYSLSVKPSLAASNACQCSENTSYNALLPSSHPNNRCATESTDVSWKNWLTGKSRSNQFHFLDLLELLHGHKSKASDDIPANTDTPL